MTLFSDDHLDYKLLTRDEVESALQLQAQTMLQEKVAIGVGMFEEPGAPEQMSLLFREVIKNGSTLIAVDRETGQLAAVAFNKIHGRPTAYEKEGLEKFIETNFISQSCKELIRLLDNIESSVDIFDECNVNGAMELFYLGTNPLYQGRGIGRRIVEKCIEFGRGVLNGSMKRTTIDGIALDNDTLPELIYGIFTSNYSQNIARKLGFATLHEIRYEDYTFAGKRMSERIGSGHRTAKLQVLKFE